MSRFVYFDYRGEFPQSITFPKSPVRYRYIVEVSKKDCDGGDRDQQELRRVARSLLHMSLGHEKTEIVVNSQSQTELEQKHFDKITKAQIYSTWDGAVYRVRRSKGRRSKGRVLTLDSGEKPVCALKRICKSRTNQ